jgi:hypothetical protein
LFVGVAKVASNGLARTFQAPGVSVTGAPTYVTGGVAVTGGFTLNGALTVSAGSMSVTSSTNGANSLFVFASNAGFTGNVLHAHMAGVASATNSARTAMKLSEGTAGSSGTTNTIFEVSVVGLPWLQFLRVCPQ